MRGPDVYDASLEDPLRCGCDYLRLPALKICSHVGQEGVVVDAAVVVVVVGWKTRMNKLEEVPMEEVDGGLAA